MENTQKNPSVHEILARSYSTYLICIFAGLVVDYFFHVRIVSDGAGSSVGFLLLLVGGVLILWAQKTSNDLRKRPKPLQIKDFEYGPYMYTRQPTNIGLVVLTLGFAFLQNSVALLVTLSISFLISRSFIKKQESILSDRYGENYRAYQNEVRKWF